jgi:hypothetical protein
MPVTEPFGKARQQSGCPKTGGFRARLPPAFETDFHFRKPVSKEHQYFPDIHEKWRIHRSLDTRHPTKRVKVL